MTVARPGKTLCLVLLTYVRPLDEVDAAMADHVAWIEAQVADGAMLVAGRRDPRTGGVLLFRGDRADVAARAAGDPFVTAGVATAEVIAFSASLADPRFAALLA